MPETSLSDFPELSFSINEPATYLFEQWLTQARAQVPHRLDTDKVGTYLALEAVQQAILDALYEVAHGKEARWWDEAWCEGFLQGYVQSSLSVKWSNELLEMSVELKNALWLKAMISYLDTFPEPRKHVNRIYRAMIDQDAELLTPNPDPDILQAHYLVSDIQEDANWQCSRTYLEARVVADVTEAVNNQKTISLSRDSRAFTSEQLRELVNLNPYL